VRSVLWDGPDPKDRESCPYSIEFHCKPAPASSLSSLESGRLLLTVILDGNAHANVTSTTIKITNIAKRENLDKLQGISYLKQQTLLSKELVQDSHQPSKWLGEIGIPSSWIEGGTQTYEKTGSAPPKSNKNLFILEITYLLENTNICTARFGSEDVFHWRPRSDVML